jgi:hypothetical protein
MSKFIVTSNALHATVYGAYTNVLAEGESFTRLILAGNLLTIGDISHQVSEKTGTDLSFDVDAETLRGLSNALLFVREQPLTVSLNNGDWIQIEHILF